MICTAGIKTIICKFVIANYSFSITDPCCEFILWNDWDQNGIK